MKNYLLLKKRIGTTEESTSIGDRSLTDLRDVLAAVTYKVAFVEATISRGDLGKELKSDLYKQLSAFRIVRDSLDLNIQQCVWETDLL